MSTVTELSSLSVVPRGRGGGFRATIRGNILELADPTHGDAFAPTPDDLYVAAIAAGFAWSARGILRASGLPEEVSVSTSWRTHEHPPGVVDLNVTVVVSRRAAVVKEALAAALDENVAARSLVKPVVHVSVEQVT